MKKLRIAQFAASGIPIPTPPNCLNIYAPIRIATNIASILPQRGHQIICFGPKGSKSQNFEIKQLNLKPLYKNPIFNETTNLNEKEKIHKIFDQYYIANIFLEHKKTPFDIVHIHPIDQGMPLAFLFPDIHVVYTLHDPISPWRAKAYEMFRSPNQHLISISDNQRKGAPKLNYFSTVYNGIDLKLFTFSERPKNNLLWIGRIVENKGVYDAIRVAKKTDRSLQLIGLPNQGEYWEAKIKPHLSENIRYLGFVANEKLYRYYQQAKVFLMPIMWEEPFGLVVPEANACGTPVVAFARGSMPELIKDGYNGFLIKPGDVQAMAKAVQRIYDMPEEEYRLMRLNCRKHVEENFTVEKMVDGYERVYQKIVQKQRLKKRVAYSV